MKLESSELVELEEGVGHVPDLSSHFRDIPWLGHLHCWRSRCYRRIPCQQRCCACRTDRLCGRLWAWSVCHIIEFPSSSDSRINECRSDGLGSIERSAANWSDAHLYLHSGHVRRAASTHGSRYQLWYAHGLPLSDWLLRLADPCDGRSDHRRYVRSKEARLW